MTQAVAIEAAKRVKDQVDAFSRKDWEAWSRQVTEDLIYEEPATNRKIQGAANVVEGLKFWTKAFPDIKGTVTNVVAEGDKVAFEVLWEGTQTGALEVGGKTIPPTGQSGTVRAMEFVKLREGKIAELHHYFDMMEVLRQAGVGM